MNRVVFELDNKLVKGELLIYEGNGHISSVDIHLLLPELKEIEKLKTEIKELKEVNEDLVNKVKELRGED